MPPHCDSLDGPVVAAARQALDSGDVEIVLAYVPAAGETEVRAAFDRVLPLRERGDDVWDTVELWFFETVVRVHRAGEGAPFTGLKPAGLPVGPVIPLAERAVATGSSHELADFLADELRQQLEQRLERVRHLGAQSARSLGDQRRYVEAVLGLEVYCHHLHQAMLAADEHSGVDHTEAAPAG